MKVWNAESKLEKIKLKYWQTVIPENSEMFFVSGLYFDIDKLTQEYNSTVQMFRPTRQWGISSKTNANWKTINLVGSCGEMYDDTIRSHCNFEKTELCDYIPYTRSILEKFEKLGLKLRRVRYSILEPSELIPWHFDKMHTCLRMHIPLITNPDVRFVLGNQKIDMKPGKLYIGNFNYPHYVFNGGTENRVHLLIDAIGPMNLLFDAYSLWVDNLEISQKKLNNYTKSLDVKLRYKQEMEENVCYNKISNNIKCVMNAQKL